MSKLRARECDERRQGAEKIESQINKLFGCATEKLMDIYVLFYLCLFPLCVHDKYYDVLKFHFNIFWKPTLLYGIVFLILGLLYMFCDAIYNHGNIRRTFSDRLNKHNSNRCGEQNDNNIRMINKGLGSKIKNTCEVLNLYSMDVAITILLLVLILSTVFAEYPYEAFWGNRGRNQGLLTWLMFYLAYWLVTRFYKFKKWHIYAYMGFASVVCIWGISNFFLNTYGMFEGTSDIYKYTFVSSIGNINTYTGFTGILYAVSAGMFISSKKIGTTIYSYVILLIVSFAHIMGISDNAVLSMGIVFATAPLVMWKNCSNIARYFIVVITYLTAMKITSIITLSGIETMNDPDPSFQITLAGKEFFGVIIAAAVIMGLAFIGFAFKEKLKKYNSSCEKSTDEEKNKKVTNWLRENNNSTLAINRLKKAWCMIIMMTVLIIITVLYLANTGWNEEIWAPYRNILVFNDSWGTGRGLAWRLGMEYWRNDATLFAKLFGYGPDTFYIITMDRFMNVMQKAGYGMFDSAHNEYYEYFLTIGIFGLVAYIVTLVTAVRCMLRDGEDAKVLALAVLAYACQAAVNIAVPIMTPVFMILMYLGIKASRDSKIVRKS